MHRKWVYVVWRGERKLAKGFTIIYVVLFLLVSDQ